MTGPVAVCDGVQFGYRRRVVLSGFDLALEPGITGLLGPNGAGKSTLLALLSTRRTADRGSVMVLGHDANGRGGRAHIRSRIGVLPQHVQLVGSMRVIDVVTYAGWTHGVARKACFEAAVRIVERVGISHLASRRVRTLSGGQRQMVGLAATLVHEPELLFLDEPTAGLDPQVRMALRRVLKDISGDVTVVLSTHLVDDVLAVCDQILVLAGGQLRFQGAPAALEELADDGGSETYGSGLERGYGALLLGERGR